MVERALELGGLLRRGRDLRRGRRQLLRGRGDGVGRFFDAGEAVGVGGHEREDALDALGLHARRDVDVGRSLENLAGEMRVAPEMKRADRADHAAEIPGRADVADRDQRQHLGHTQQMPGEDLGIDALEDGREATLRLLERRSRAGLR